MRKTLILQHIEIEPPALIADILEQKKFTLDYCHGYRGEDIPQEVSGYDALVVMGGPMGVYEADQFPFLKKEMRLIESAIKQKKPVLGVCLGSQLLAHVLGAKVYPGKQKEIGWHRLELSPRSPEDPLFKSAPQAFMGFHWHGDVFDLPKGAVALASSELTPVQAYRYGQNVYGLLFHMEVNHEIINRWVNGFSGELMSAKIDGQAILRKSPEYLSGLQMIGKNVFEAWAGQC